MKLYDPRREDDYRQSEGAWEFSSLHQNMLVLETEPKRRMLGFVSSFESPVTFDRICAPMLASMKKTGSRGFVMCHPQPKRLLEDAGLREIEYVASSCRSYFDLDKDFTIVLSACSCDRSEEAWIIGSAVGRCLPPPTEAADTKEFGFAYMLRHADAIGSAFYREGGWFTAFMRIFDGVDDVVQCIIDEEQNI